MSIPTVVTAKQGSYGAGWEPGAYIYRVEEEDPEEPPVDPNDPSNFTFDPRSQVFGLDPLSLAAYSIKNLGVDAIDTSEIVDIPTPYGTKAWRLSDAGAQGRILYFDSAPADSYNIKTLILYKSLSSVNAQIWPGGRIGAAVDATAGYFCGVRNDTSSRITRAVGGTFATQLDENHGLSDVEDVWLWSLFESDEDTITVKTWAYGDTEPVTPQVSITDDAIATGTAGAYLWLNNSTIDIAWIAVALEGDTLETPKVWSVKESGGDYASISLVIADEDFDDGDVIEVSGTWEDPDTVNVSFNGVSIITIKAIDDARVDPTNLASPTHYRLLTSNIYSVVQIENSDFTYFDGLDVRSSNTQDYVRCFNIYNSNNVITRNCVSGFTAQNASNQAVYRMETNNGSTCQGLIENCIAYNGGSSGVNPVVFSTSSKTIMNLNSTTVYKCGLDGGGCLRGYSTTLNQVEFNVFNSILISVDGSACMEVGAGVTWDIHDSIADDNTILSMDGSAYGCLANREPSSNLSPGEGDFVIFTSLVSPYDLTLQNSIYNDALEMHTDASGAGMDIPLLDILGNPRPYLTYDCGAHELLIITTTLAPTTVIPSIIPNSVCWGASFSIQLYNLPFTDRWSGDAVVSGSEIEDEKLLFYSTGSMESETWNIGALGKKVKLSANVYNEGEGSVTIQYKQGDSLSACESDTWHNYTSPFACAGWIKIKVIAS